jgi:hypothetical protein
MMELEFSNNEGDDHAMIDAPNGSSVFEGNDDDLISPAAQELDLILEEYDSDVEN